MPRPSDREAFRKLLVEYFAIKTSEELGGLTFPPESELEKLRNVAAPRADEILRKYESDLAINKITTAVVDQLRGNLIARSRVAHIIEIAINVSSLIVGLLIGAWLIFAEPEKNPVQTTFVLWAVLAIAGLQLFGNLFLRYFDKNR